MSGDHFNSVFLKWKLQYRLGCDTGWTWDLCGALFFLWDPGSCYRMSSLWATHTWHIERKSKSQIYQAVERGWRERDRAGRGATLRKQRPA